MPSPDRSAAPHPPLRMSCGEAHRLARATRGKLPVTPPSWEKLSTEPTGHPATGIRKLASAATSPVGWFGRSGNTSGPWMPAADMPSDTTCSSRLRWSAPVPFTTGHLSIQPMELPEALKRKAKKHRVGENKKRYGTSISSRPEIASLRLEEGHWEGDTVVGKRAGKEAVVFSLLEKKTETYLAFRIPGKTSEAVMNLMNALHDEYGEHFSQVFKTITVDNGSEFADFAQVENWGSKVFFAHPYTSWERPQNERHNGLFRAFVPKGASIEGFADEDILTAADELNGRPRKKLGYCTPEELFEAFLDAVYAA